MKTKFLGLVILGALGLTACGDSKNADNGGYASGQAAILPPPNGYCAPEVVNAYNNFAVRCDSINSDIEVQACRFSAEHFLRNYEGINCVAVPGINNGNYDGQFFNQYQGQQVFQITDYPMKNVLQVLGRQPNGGDWRRGHKRWPRVGHRR